MSVEFRPAPKPYTDENLLESSFSVQVASPIRNAAEAQLREHATCAAECQYRINAFRALKAVNALRNVIPTISEGVRHLNASQNGCSCEVRSTIKAERDGYLAAHEEAG